jgi:hypothetical protein
MRICWDLDNTLVDSGALIRLGKRLEEAVIEAEPVPNMLRFYESIQARLPRADHVILTSRTDVMRVATLAWLARHGLAPAEDAIWFVPDPKAKVKVWLQLARDARLVIIDDLSYNHESARPAVHHDLVERAVRIAAVYVGLEQIAAIQADLRAVERVTSWVIEGIGA